MLNRQSRTSGAEFARLPRSTRASAVVSKNLVVANLLELAASAEAHLSEEEEDIELSEIGSGEDALRRQRAHDVARTLESSHLEGSEDDPETMAIAQRYVDGEITIDELTAAIEARSTDVW